MRALSEVYAKRALYSALRPTFWREILLKAAVVVGADSAPRWVTFEDPVPDDDEVIVTVAAAALSPLVRARASGQHYSSTGHISVVPGIDGVGRLDDGRRVYFAFPRSPFGTMA